VPRVPSQAGAIANKRFVNDCRYDAAAQAVPVALFGAKGAGLRGSLSIPVDECMTEGIKGNLTGQQLCLQDHFVFQG
jgi:hypothetical protein